MSLPGNKVTIKDSSRTVLGMQFVPGSVVVSKGKSFDGTVRIRQSGLDFILVLEAERSGTAAVAKAFNTACGGGPYEYAPSGGGGGSPDKLNFFFAVDVECVVAQGQGHARIYLAQGHHGAENNWWIGGSGVLSAGPSLTVAVGGSELVLPLSGTHDSFELKPGKIR